jgi:3-dehydroquinate synthase
LAELPRLLHGKAIRPPYIIIADGTVAALHGEAVQQALGGALITFPSGEANKNLDTVRVLYSECVSRGLERDGSLVAVGGGVAGDMVGFVAATYMRGVGWANVPTTVLAMADASLGGKVGVDLPQGKNLVGAFHPPALVAADFDFLSTLPAVEVRCGLAEIYKAGIIGDAGLFEGLPSGAVPLERAIVRAAAVKVGVVNADPFEHGERATLNLGHTIGHGVEAASGYQLRHGEAVAIGLLAEARLAERVRLAEAGLAERISAGLQRLELPTRCAGLDPAAIRAAMNSDKKRAGGRLKFALPRRPGEVVWGREVNEAELMATLEDITRAA